MNTIRAAADAAARAQLARLLVGRALPAGAVTYVVVMHVEKCIAARLEAALDSDPFSSEAMERMSVICEAHGCGDGWPQGEGPPEFESARADWSRRYCELKAQLYAEAGQPALAELIACDQTTFEGLCEVAAEVFAVALVRTKKFTIRRGKP